MTNTGINIGLMINLEYMKNKMNDMLEKKFTMSKLFNLNHRALRRKEYAKRVYDALKIKEKNKDTLELGIFKDFPSYRQDNQVESFFDINLLIDTNKERIAEFTDSIAKLRIIYENQPKGFFYYAGHISFEHHYYPIFSPIFSLLDNDLGILKGDQFPSENVFEYDKLLKFGGNIETYFENDFEGIYGFEVWGKTVDKIDMVIEEIIHPNLSKMFDNVPQAICGVKKYAPTTTIINNQPLSAFPIAHPEKLKVKPEYKEEFKKYKSQYDANCEAFRIHKL